MAARGVDRAQTATETPLEQPFGPTRPRTGTQPHHIRRASARSQPSRLRTPKAPATFAVSPTWRFGASSGPKRRRKRHSGNPLGPLGRAPGRNPTTSAGRPRVASPPACAPPRRRQRSRSVPHGDSGRRSGPNGDGNTAQATLWAHSAALTGLKHRARDPVAPLGCTPGRNPTTSAGRPRVACATQGHRQRRRLGLDGGSGQRLGPNSDGNTTRATLWAHSMSRRRPGVSAGPGSTPSEEHSTRPTARGRGRGHRAQIVESPRT